MKVNFLLNSAFHLQNFRHLRRVFGKFFKDLCFPPCCCICGSSVEDDGICAECWKKIRWISDPKCGICGTPFEFPSQNICSDCLQKRPHFDKVVSAFTYNYFSKKIILKFKNGDCTYLAQLLANLMCCVGMQILQKSDLLIPVPMTFWKRLKRKYNQAELLCIEILKIVKNFNDNDFDKKIIYTPRLLKKIKSTHPQEGLSRKQRQINLRGAFDVEKKYVRLLKGKNVTLVDDVMTTGSTLNECAKILKKYGAKNVFAITTSRVTLIGK